MNVEVTFKSRTIKLNRQSLRGNSTNSEDVGGSQKRRVVIRTEEEKKKTTKDEEEKKPEKIIDQVFGLYMSRSGIGEGQEEKLDGLLDEMTKPTKKHKKHKHKEKGKDAKEGSKKKKKHKKEKKKEKKDFEKDEENSGKRRSKDGECHTSGKRKIESDVGSEKKSKRFKSGAHHDSEKDMGHHQSESKHSKDRDTHSGHRHRDDDSENRLKTDISDLRLKLDKLKHHRDIDIGKKHGDRKRRHRSSSGHEAQERSRQHSKEKRHSITLEITAPIEVEMYDQSITPPHSSPEYEYDSYYRHPEDVKPVFEGRDIDKGYDSSKYDDYSLEAEKPRGDECRSHQTHHTRGPLPPPRRNPEIRPGRIDSRQSYSREPYHALPRRDDKDFPDGYTDIRAARLEWLTKRQSQEASGETKQMIEEAEQMLRQSKTEEEKQKGFVSFGDKMAKDHVIYDVLVRDGPDGLENIDDKKEEVVKVEEVKKEEVVEEEEEVKEEEPNLEDDIETKEQEMVREMRGRMERRLKAKQDREQREEEERKKVELRENDLLAMEEEKANLEAELQKILTLSDQDYVNEYGMTGALRKKPEYEDVEPGEVTPDESEAYEVVVEPVKKVEESQSSLEIVEALQDPIPPPITPEVVVNIAKPPAADETDEPLPPGVAKEDVSIVKVPPPVALQQEPSPEATKESVWDTSQADEVKEGDGISAKKPQVKMGIKISSASAALISSQMEKETQAMLRVKAREDGELSESSMGDNESKNGEDTTAKDPVSSSSDDELPESSGSITDSDDEKTKKKKKKKKKSKKSKKKKLKRSSRERNRERDSEKMSSSSIRSHDRHKKRRSRSRSRSHDRRKDVWSTRSHDRQRSRSRERTSRHHTRELVKERYSGQNRGRGGASRYTASHSTALADPRLGIDKAKLRQIAIRNATYNAKTGRGPPLDLPPEEMATLRAGGKSLGDLTDYCKRIAEKQKRKGDDDSSGEEATHMHSEDEDSLFINHPFKVKDAPIIMNIRNSRQLPVMTVNDKSERSKTLRLEFPVSSGSQHRRKEDEWVPVEKNTSSTASELAVRVAPPPAKKIMPALCPPPPPPVFSVGPTGQPLPPGVSAPKPVAAVQPSVATPSAAVAAAAAAADGTLSTVGGVAVDIAKARAEQEKAERLANEAAKKVEIEAMKLAADEKKKVFTAPPEQNFNIGDLVSARLSAMRKLQDNPMDVEAMSSMFKSQKHMTQWAESKQLPGQFLGSTGAQVLSQQELLGDPRNQAWAKKDTFKKAAPLGGGVGRFLLEKMGWREGTGLGKEGRGTLEPIMLDVKNDRKGLNADGENDKKSQKTIMTAGAGSTAGKHPVSALMELCKRRRWGAPAFDQISEHGPPHRKMFLFKVQVNNVDYQPNVASGTKKSAKLNAAIVCLQTLGIPCQSS